MDKISLCNPDARILKHLSLNLDKMSRNISAYCGLVNRIGLPLSGYYDVMSYIEGKKEFGKEFVLFGENVCHHKTFDGHCAGHNSEDVDAPKDFQITDVELDIENFNLFDEIKHGKLRFYPLLNELQTAREGDFITLKSSKSDEKIKLIITSTYGRYEGMAALGVWPVYQREKSNGKVQYFI